MQPNDDDDRPLTRDAAISGLAAACHLLLGIATGALVGRGLRADQAWRELTPTRLHVMRCCRALGLPTLTAPYDDDPADDPAGDPNPNAKGTDTDAT